MKIVQISAFEEPVPAKKYGGVERVVYSITEELINRGHEVYLFASGDSKTSAKLVPVLPKAMRKYPLSRDSRFRETMKWVGINKAIKKIKELKPDIIHSHLNWRFICVAELLNTPTVSTLHGPINDKPRKPAYKELKHLNYVSISNAQRKFLPELNFVATVYNGIEVKKFDFSKKGGNYLAFLGRMSEEKGAIEAIKIAKGANLPMKMASKIDVVDEPYFKKGVKPLIDGRKIKFIGEIAHTEKVKLLKNAKALILPINWEEPFGLVMPEAMACGTPVIVFDRGSAREVVKNGKTGFVVKNVKEAVKAVKKIDTIKRENCRKWVEEKFTVEKMVDGYEKIYRKIIKPKK
ncbi:MAG: glycosyltransferase family 4 protein [Candidatus Pacebacteria bacterium]|nr:glycosyltransferase family 4 protein [Candidatus Paceibacterota bacterium]